MKGKSFWLALILIMIFGIQGCTPSGKEESPEAEIQKPATHIGGCVLAVPAAEAPGDVYQETEIVPTDEYKPFTKKKMVYGITLIARDDISDEFINKVGETIKAMFSPEGQGINRELQQELLRNLYRYRTVIPLFKGRNYEFSPEDEKLWDETTRQNSICDIIMEGVSGQVNEVVEHILHHVSDVGFHYTFPEAWGISKNSRVYKVMEAAIEKNYYDVDQYQDIDEDEVKLRVLIQEFAYWIIYTSWDLRRTYGPFEAEWSLLTVDELKELLPQGYQLFEDTVPQVMTCPPRELLEQLKKFETQD